MDISQAIALGLLQGLSEFLPVSSSAHLIAARWLLGWRDPGLAFDVALHIGTLAAVLLYFHKDWARLLRSALLSLRRSQASAQPGGMLAWYILLGTIPAAVAGALAEDEVEALFHGSSPDAKATGILVIGLVMIGLAALMWLAERSPSHRRRMEELTLRQVLLIGLAQAAAIVPGVSRSGSTITAGLFMNLEREAAARFSFLLGTPLVAGAGLKQVFDLFMEGGLPAGEIAPFTFGFLAAAVSGYAAIFGLLRFLQRNSTLPFVLYRVVAGVLLITLVLAGFRQGI